MKFKRYSPLIIFCRVMGENNKVRELTATIEPSFEYCWMLRSDAAFLGYPSVTSRPEDWVEVHPDEVVYITTLRGIESATLIKVKEIAIGKLKAKNVETVVTATEFPLNIPVSMFLGRSFLRHFRLRVEPDSGTFSLLQPPDRS